MSKGDKSKTEHITGLVHVGEECFVACTCGFKKQITPRSMSTDSEFRLARAEHVQDVLAYHLGIAI